MKIHGVDHGSQSYSKREAAGIGEERHLWVTVILQAIDDATSHWPAGSSHWLDAVNTIVRAREWLLEDSHDFREVCSNAGIDPGALRRRVFKLRDDGWSRTILSEMELRANDVRGGNIAGRRPRYYKPRLRAQPVAA